MKISYARSTTTWSVSFFVVLFVSLVVCWKGIIFIRVLFDFFLFTQTHSQPELQEIAVSCISNLLNNDEGSGERQFKLKYMGAQRILQKLIHSDDAHLLEKASKTLEQFSSNVNMSASSATVAAAANSTSISSPGTINVVMSSSPPSSTSSSSSST